MAALRMDWERRVMMRMRVMGGRFKREGMMAMESGSGIRVLREDRG
jgi:hypothetical protein